MRERGVAKILIIDDEKQIRTVMRKLLEKEGHSVIEAENGAEGIDAYCRQPADLVITDIIMPEKEGIETIKEFMNEFPGIKIIATSGGSQLLTPELGLDVAKCLGAVRTLKKPFSSNELIEAVNDVLGNK
ncbi:response regulator [candidate division KSB1 bacterium]|nr:response regulator [candidate division KSB1 bacterium]